MSFCGAGTRVLPTNGYHRAKALQSGRTRAELLESAITQTRRLVAPGALKQACTTQAMVPGALEQAYTTQAGAGLIAIELKSGKIIHQSPSFQDLALWIPAEARGNIRVSLESRDGDDFDSFCQSVVKDAGQLFLDHDKVLGRCIMVRFFTRAPGPSGLRNPEWLLMMRAVTLKLVGVQPRKLAGGSPGQGMLLPFFGQARIPEVIGIFTADLSGGMPSQWTVQAAHIRNLLDMGVAPGTYEIEEVGKQNPMEKLATFFNFEFSNGEGGGVGDSIFSRAAAHLENAATGALNIAQRSASWLACKALRVNYQWSMCLNNDDTVSITGSLLLLLIGGVSTSVSLDLVAGRALFSQGGLDVLYFVADPTQPLDGNLRTSWVRIASAKTAGEFEVHRPLVIAYTWGGGRFHLFCKKLADDAWGTKMRPSVDEDVSQLFEQLKVSPGGGGLSDGNAKLCIGHSDVQPGSPADW